MLSPARQTGTRPAKSARGMGRLAQNAEFIMCRCPDRTCHQHSFCTGATARPH
ncbi:hypothetical protein D9X30_0272 [Cupriavidus sp. U2]|nr:hypothetical protein D9X30_0272 [Cupriavidus sp. U2]